MKFAIAVVLLAVACGAQASAVWSPWGPTVYAALEDDGQDRWPLVRGAINDGQWHEGVWGDRSAWAARAAWGAPALVAGPVVAAHAAVAGPAIVPGIVPVAHEGSYVAQTRGATHVAPLSGHANSAASINLQPAPGTV